MCFPGAPLILGAAQGIASFASQQSQYANQETQYRQNYINALSDNRDTENRLQAQEMEENASYEQKDNLALIEGAQKDAQIRTAAATGGVAGNSVNDIVNGVNEQINLKRDTLQQNWTAQVQQTESEKVAGVAQESSRIGEVANPVPPTPFGAVLSVAGAGINYANSPSGQSFFGSIGDGFGASASGGGDASTSGAGLFVSTNGQAAPGP